MICSHVLFGGYCIYCYIAVKAVNRDILVHTDASQSCGKIEVRMQAVLSSLVSLEKCSEWIVLDGMSVVCEACSRHGVIY